MEVALVLSFKEIAIRWKNGRMNLWGEPGCRDLDWSWHGNRTGYHVYKRTWGHGKISNICKYCLLSLGAVEYWPAWQRAVKEDSMEGISRGRHRRQAPASMQKDAATLSRYGVGGLILNMSSVCQKILPQNISGSEKEEEQTVETRLHSRGSPTRWTRQLLSLSSQTPGFQSNRHVLPGTFSADWAMGPKVFQMAHCSIVKREKRARIHHLCQCTRTCPVSDDTTSVIFLSVLIFWNIPPYKDVCHW